MWFLCYCCGQVLFSLFLLALPFLLWRSTTARENSHPVEHRTDLINNSIYTRLESPFLGKSHRQTVYAFDWRPAAYSLVNGEAKKKKWIEGVIYFQVARCQLQFRIATDWFFDEFS